MTHAVAVTGYICEADRFLLLKRANPPTIWTPPGGHLHPNEPPESGLIREVLEETGYNIEVVGIVDTWFGKVNGSPLLSLDYLVKITGGTLTLSSEHADSTWMSLDELKKSSILASGASPGFHIEDFAKAFQLYSSRQY